MRVVLASLVLTVALGGPAAAAATAPSGVEGRVISRQSGLGCVRVSCFKPVAGVTVTFARGDRQVRATSDRLGRFRIALSPGVWTARAPGLAAPTGALAIRVREGRYLPVALFVRRAATLR